MTYAPLSARYTSLLARRRRRADTVSHSTPQSSPAWRACVRVCGRLASRPPTERQRSASYSLPLRLFSRSRGERRRHRQPDRECVCVCVCDRTAVSIDRTGAGYYRRFSVSAFRKLSFVAATSLGRPRRRCIRSRPSCSQSDNNGEEYILTFRCRCVACYAP